MTAKTLFASLLLALLILQTGAQSVQGSRNIGLNDVCVIELAGNGDSWVGSRGQGVGFYNSAIGSWAYFSTSNTPQFKSDSVTSISFGAIGPDRYAIVGTTNGLVLNRAGTWDTLGPLPSPRVTGVGLLNSDTLWVTTDNGVAAFDTAGFTLIQFYNTGNSSLPYNQISTVNRGGMGCGGGYTAGTPNNGVFFTGNGIAYSKIDTSAANHKLVDNRVNTIFQDNNCTIKVVGTKGGLSVCPTGFDCASFTTSNGLPQNDITSIQQDCKGRFWLGTRDSGVVIFTPPTTFSRITTADGLPDNRITAISIIQTSCEVWVGSKSGDIAVVDSNAAVQNILSGVESALQTEVGVKVYPQPANGKVNFSFANEIESGQLSVFDLNGRTVTVVSLQDTTRATVDVSTFAAGLYYYNLIGNSQILAKGKLLVNGY